jgi:glutamate carboxypeptidase
VAELSDRERRVCERIGQRGERMLADLAAHVAIPTGGNHQRGLDEYRGLLLDRLHRLGGDAELIPGEPRPAWLFEAPRPAGHESAHIPPTAVIRHRCARPRGRILIAGHLDTVHDPAGPFQHLAVSSDGTTATGPGAADMKGGLLIAVHALEALAESGFEFNWTVLLNSDEETGSFHSFRALQNAAREHEAGLVVEPALPGGGLVVERMGSGQFMVEAFGRAAHVGRDFEKGISAVNALAEAMVRLARLSDPPRGLIVNIGPLRGGTATNVVAEHAACWGNVRYASMDLARELEKRLEALAAPPPPVSRPEPPSDRARLVVHHMFSRPVKPLTPAVQALANAARAVAESLGQPLPFGRTGGVCDGNILHGAGLPTIDTLGVRGGNLHRNDEFIEVASLVERCRLLAVLLMRLAEGGAPPAQS